MRSYRSWFCCVGVLLALSACGGDDDSTMDAGVPDGFVPEPPIVDIPNPTLVQTSAPEQVRAGELIPVTCVILDDAGEVYSAAGRTPRIRVSPATSVRFDGDDIVAIQTGEVEVSCAFSDLMLTDESPAIVRIVPGDPAEVVTTVDRSSIEAGETISVTCETFDAFGNPIPDAEPTMAVDPTDDGNTTDGRTTTFTAAGRYEVSCDLDGAASTSERVEVNPTVPASLALARVPDQPVYAIGQIVEVASIVTDRYDNPITDAPVGFVSEPAGSTLGRNRFRYLSDGIYVVTATVAPPTEGDVELTAQVTIVVDGNGPSVQCTSPADGSMLNAVPGSTVTFEGSVADTSGIESVRVNGTTATLGDGGDFSAPLTVDFGINFVDIVARDEFGAESSHTCAFLASNRWADPSTTFGDTVGLSLGMDGIDDGDRADGLDSLNDLLYLVINSEGLRTQLHDALIANNPLKPDSCDQRVFGVCVFRSEINYLNNRLGARTTDLTLIDGGMHARVRLDNVEMQLRVSGTVNNTGWIMMDYVDIDVDFDVALAGGRPQITVRPGSVMVEVGRITADFSGFSGLIIDIILAVANGQIRDIVANIVGNYVSTNFNDVLDGVVSGLDISTLGSTFSVPRIDGSGTLDVNFGVGFSHINSNPTRLLMGIGTRFSGPTVIANPTLGVAVPPGTAGAVVRDDPALMGRSMGVSIHTALFNQVFHALWRGGLLRGTITGDGTSFPEGVVVVLDGSLPPVAEMDEEGTVNVGIGTLNLSLVYPGLFDDPLPVTLGARSTANVRLVGNDLAFDGIVIDELFFSTREVSLDEETREILEGFLISLVQSLVDSVLNDSLPAIPIPSFELPASLATYGVPVGTELGIRSPTLANEPQHFVLRGNFGSL